MIIHSSKKRVYKEGELRLVSKFLWWPYILRSSNNKFDNKKVIWWETIWILEKWGYTLNKVSRRSYGFQTQEIIKPILDRNVDQLNLMLEDVSSQDYNLARGIIYSRIYLKVI